MSKYISLSKKIAIPESFTFDDVLLLPNYSDFLRTEISLRTQLHPKVVLNLPILSSPMDTVTESQTAITMALNGGLGIIHRNLAVEEQIENINQVKNFVVDNATFPDAAVDEKNRLLVGVSVGVDNNLIQNVGRLVEAGADIVVLDTAHGHAKYIVQGVWQIKSNFDIPVMAGNITTFDAAIDLMSAGADALRVGMGPGSICTTRIVTGIGVPQLTAINEVVRAVKTYKKRPVAVVADGGIKQLGDIAKALGFGASAVMLGSMLAGYKQSPGEIINIENKKYKTYRGMGSVSAMSKSGGLRYGQNTKDPKKLVPEGVEGLVAYKGDLNDFLYQARGALLSSFYYVGSKNIEEFYEKAQFVKITNAALKESHPHTINVVNTGASYL